MTIPHLPVAQAFLAAFSSLSLLLSPGLYAQEAADEEPLRVLLLDYHQPLEHDVLLSHLCVERCTASAGCPEALLKDGVDFWNDELAVHRPGYLGRSARFVVGAYKDRDIDFLSMSGHHASGFSGELGRGSFHTTKLASQLRDLEGRDGFFTSPSMVMLQGCWTDVKSGFDGDPIEYVRHIVEDTAVRDGEAARLLAAIQQIAGEHEAYRELFPNACILGYEGTQIPGGLAEIYGQANNFFRAVGEMMGQTTRPSKYSFAEARRTTDGLNQLVRDIDRECGGQGWPCNLCEKDPEYYQPLADAFTQALRGEKARLRSGLARQAGEAASLERKLEDSSLYNNVRWSCSTVPTETPPIFPEPIDRGPHLELFVELMMIDLGNIEGEERHRLESELVHLLGATEVEPAVRERLRQRQESPQGAAWRQAFIDRTLRRLSTFRQRDFYDFLSTVGCGSCFREAFTSEVPRQMRENAASQLRPRLGPEVYRLALEDSSPRVRLLAASRLSPTLGEELIALARRDPDPRVAEAVEKALRSPPVDAPSP